MGVMVIIFMEPWVHHEQLAGPAWCTQYRQKQAQSKHGSQLRKQKFTSSHVSEGKRARVKGRELLWESTRVVLQACMFRREGCQHHTTQHNTQTAEKPPSHPTSSNLSQTATADSSRSGQFLPAIPTRQVHSGQRVSGSRTVFVSIKFKTLCRCLF